MWGWWDGLYLNRDDLDIELIRPLDELLIRDLDELLTLALDLEVETDLREAWLLEVDGR